MRKKRASQDHFKYTAIATLNVDGSVATALYFDGDSDRYQRSDEIFFFIGCLTLHLNALHDGTKAIEEATDLEDSADEIDAALEAVSDTNFAKKFASLSENDFHLLQVQAQEQSVDPSATIQHTWTMSGAIPHLPVHDPEFEMRHVPIPASEQRPDYGEIASDAIPALLGHLLARYDGDIKQQLKLAAKVTGQNWLSDGFQEYRETSLMTFVDVCSAEAVALVGNRLSSAVLDYPADTETDDLFTPQPDAEQDSLSERLSRIDRLLDIGIITPEEHESHRKRTDQRAPPTTRT